MVCRHTRNFEKELDHGYYHRSLNLRVYELACQIDTLLPVAWAYCVSHESPVFDIPLSNLTQLAAGNVAYATFAQRQPQLPITFPPLSHLPRQRAKCSDFETFYA